MQKKRILIVEDEDAISHMIAMNLKVEGYDTQIYGDGAEAADALAADHRYDLALLDVMLPGMNGFELLPIISGYDIPVIFLTARDDIDAKIQGLTGGAEDYVSKPFNVLELMARIENVLRRSTPYMQTSLHFMDIDIDLERHTVMQGGREVVLKPMEYDLLVVLVRNKNRAISRERLLNMVWGVEYVGETRTVDVHIGQLRKKLGLQSCIKTISKMGYRLEEPE